MGHATTTKSQTNILHHTHTQTHTTSIGLDFKHHFKLNRQPKKKKKQKNTKRILSWQSKINRTHKRINKILRQANITASKINI